ncbi:aconitate hydratase [Dermatobacter hominis]|uniref:aconitate hydratase n=1 Tax=Dermatobacter hominis TaxID=2884263 RepID=UPI001D0F8F6F|nr:aconitate hydratase [Dermatobacter hominis]UDY34156.1 aconitate hydratase [Dermatobacter hominis]
MDGHDVFGTDREVELAGRTRRIRCLQRLAEALPGAAELPVTTRILVEDLLRHDDGSGATADVVRALVDGATSDEVIDVPFHPGRVLMQDFTGVPAIADLAAVRDAVGDLTGDPGQVRPEVPVDLVIDHSVSVDSAGSPDSLAANELVERERNSERYDFLEWGRRTFAGFEVLGPGAGICHQVNLERLATVVREDRDGTVCPDTLVGTDSHTTMVNGLGVLGWGVGGIEAEAAMLGEPVSVAVPGIVGVELAGSLRPGVTATDLVLTITEALRSHGVVGRFVEFHGAGLAALPAEARATISNMSPEYGSTAAMFPIDDETLAYLRRTGRSPDRVATVEAYARHQGLWRSEAPSRFADALRVRLDEVEPCLAGPSLPQQRVPLAAVPGRVAAAIAAVVGSGEDPSETDRAIRTRRPGVPSNGRPAEVRAASADDASAQSFPASDPPALDADDPVASQPWEEGDAAEPGEPTAARVVPVSTGHGAFDLTDGHVVIAAITSCTNTSNPAVMVGAGLLARAAVDRGLRTPPWVKTSLAPGSRTVVRYLEDAGLAAPLAALGFHVVGFGCTTCIGNSGPLAPEISAAIRHRDLAVCAVLSGNRNFEGRIHPDVRMNFLASPPLVVAAALAGHMEVDLSSDPLGVDEGGSPVRLADLWPSDEEVADVVGRVVRPQLFAVGAPGASDAGGAEAGGGRATSRPVAGSSPWKDGSTYVRRPPFARPPAAGSHEVGDIVGARALVVLGDNVTTDHISPAGVIDVDSPAGRWLLGQSVDPVDFNSYGSRRGNHEVMVRGTFANPRLRNALAEERSGGWTRHLPDGELVTIHEAATRYAAEHVPLVVLAGVEYGTGSSRDWAAKGTRLLGVRAVIARSFERIHRTNLVGMGVLPLQLPDGASVGSLGLTGEEEIDVTGVVDADGELRRTATLRAGDVEVPLTVRVDNPRERAYLAAGGILPHVVRRLAERARVAG